MPIYAYYDGGTGPLWIDDVGWITSATSTATTATSSWYPFGGATSSSPTWGTITQPVWYRGGDGIARWVTLQPVREAPREEIATPAIIRERAEAETRRVNEWNARVVQQQAETKRKTEAGARARELLLEHLTPEQRRMFEKDNWFIVEGGKSKTKYRIRGGAVAGNIDVFRNDAVSHRLCCHCDHSIPYHDQHLAQKLMLEHAEDDFLRIANRQ